MFRRCPSCDHVQLECDEVGTTFPDPRDLANEGAWIHDEGALCVACGRVHVREFINPTDEELLALGFLRGEFKDG